MFQIILISAGLGTAVSLYVIKKFNDYKKKQYHNCEINEWIEDNSKRKSSNLFGNKYKKISSSE